MTHFLLYTCRFLSSTAAGDNTYRINCSINWVTRVASLCLSLHYDDYVIGSGNSGHFMNIFKSTPNLGSISAMLGSDTWNNIIYRLQNNFKSSSTTQNWRKLQHATILSCCCHFYMLRLSKNSYLHDFAHKFWRMIAWWKWCHPYTLLLLAYLKIFAKKIT